MNIEYIIAKTKDELDQCFKVRYDVFGTECNFLDMQKLPGGREIDSFDTLSTTTSFLAISEKGGIGTVRMLEKNEDVASRMGWDFGLDMENYFDLSELIPKDMNIAELPRSSVIKEYQSTNVMLSLWRLAVQHARKKGITHFVAVGNADTDIYGDALLLYYVCKQKGFVSDLFDVKTKIHSIKKDNFQYYLYDDKTRGCFDIGRMEKNPKEYDLSGLNIPKILSIFIRLGVRIIGKPIYCSSFDMCAFPIIWDINNIDRKISGIFDKPVEYRQ